MHPCKQNKKICEKSSFSFPSNQMSTKMLQAQMIRTGTKVTYNNSRIASIYSDMLSLNYETNRNMVIQYKYACYMRYFTNLLQGNIPQSTRTLLSQMLTTIVSGLSQEEYNDAFQIEPPTPPPLPKMTRDSGITFYVVNRITFSRKYFIFKNVPPDFLLDLYTYYTFDLSDPSNLNTKLSFSEDMNTGIPYQGIYYTATPGTPGSKLILNIYNDIKTLKLITFNDMPMQNYLKYSWGYSMSGLLTHLYTGKPQKNYLYYYVRQHSILSIYESAGAKYSINDAIEPILFTSLNNYRYNISYGTYYLDVPEFYAATLLNKGYEDCIAFVGDNDKTKLGNVSDVGFVEGPPREGEYTFYSGIVKMIVYKPFPFHMSIYSRDFGFMGGAELFHFTEEPKENLSTDVITIDKYKTIAVRMTTMIRFNDDTSTSTRRKYGLNYGTYRISIPSNVPIAFMNDGKEDLFEVADDTIATKSGPYIAPDEKRYIFYTGELIVKVKGNYEKMSICTQQGYSGGYQLLAYNPYAGSPIPSSYKSTQGISALRVQTPMTLYKDPITYETILNFNDESTSKYGLYKGVYMIFDIPRECPITLLNRGKENLVTLESVYPNRTIEGIGPDDRLYTFYYGILKITVRGDFGFMSLYTLYQDYMGGYKKFSYGPYFDNSDSYPDPLSRPVLTTVASNTSFTETRITDRLSHSLTLFDQDTTLEYGNLWDRTYTTNVLYVDQKVTFSIDTSLRIRYNLMNGIYILNCGNHYITLLNQGKESFISLKGNLSRRAIASDGKEYTFYSGSMVALYVLDNFEIMSLEVLGGPIGRGLFIQNTFTF